jgi:nucleoid DNA-binding protein
MKRVHAFVTTGQPVEFLRVTGKEKSEMARKTAPKKSITKTALIQAIADHMGGDVTRKQVKATLEALVAVGHKELKKNGVFVLPGFAKFTVVKKPARPARKGINPFTKEPMRYAAKPASKTVKAKPVKAAKEAVL